jgi:hypothetical protein
MSRCGGEGHRSVRQLGLVDIEMSRKEMHCAFASIVPLRSVRSDGSLSERRGGSAPHCGAVYCVHKGFLLVLSGIMLTGWNGTRCQMRKMVSQGGQEEQQESGIRDWGRAGGEAWIVGCCLVRLNSRGRGRFDTEDRRNRREPGPKTRVEVLVEGAGARGTRTLGATNGEAGAHYRRVNHG